MFETNDQLTLEILSHFVRRVCIKIGRSIKITLYVNKYEEEFKLIVKQFGLFSRNRIYDYLYVYKNFTGHRYQRILSP